MADRYLRISEVAEALGLDRSHVYALIRQGKFPIPVIRSLGHMRVSERALDKWGEENGVIVTPRPKVAAPRRHRRQAAAATVEEAELRWPVPRVR